MMVLLGVIPARSGSKAIPGKNIRPFLGRPLIEWSVSAATRSNMFTRIIVSTDGPAIAEIARAAGAEVPFLRPFELAGDAVGTASVVRHALDWLRNKEGWAPDGIVVLEPTSPGRQAVHICESAALLARADVDSVASVSRIPHHYVPEKALQVTSRGLLYGASGTHVRDMTHRRQDLREWFAFNGLIFGCRTKWLLQDPPTLWGDRVAAYEVDPVYNVDLDAPEDWTPAEARLRELLEATA